MATPSNSDTPVTTTGYVPGNVPGAAAPVPEDPQKHVRP